MREEGGSLFAMRRDGWTQSNVWNERMKEGESILTQRPWLKRRRDGQIQRMVGRREERELEINGEDCRDLHRSCIATGRLCRAQVCIPSIHEHKIEIGSLNPT